MKKFDYTDITDQVFQSTKIDQLVGLSDQVSQTVDMISMLDDGTLMDQLSGAQQVVKDLQYTVKRMKDVSGDFHLKTQSQRNTVIMKIAKG